MEYSVTIGEPLIEGYKRFGKAVQYNQDLKVEEVKHRLDGSVKEMVTGWIGEDKASCVILKLNEADKLVVVELRIGDGSAKNDGSGLLDSICEFLWLDIHAT